MIERTTRLLLRLRNRHFFLLDTMAFMLIPGAALMLRIDGTAVSRYASALLVVTVTFLLIKLPLFYGLGLYRQYWRYASIDELAQITFAAMLATLLQTIGFMGVLRPFHLITSQFPRSIPLIDGLLTLIVVGGIRYSVRFSERMRQRRRGRHAAQRILIVGAGEAGVMITREMQRNPALGLQPVGFVDDDAAKQHSRIRGIPVLGGRQDLSHVVPALSIDQVIIAMPTAPGTIIREIVEICERLRIETKVLPGISELLDGTVSVSQLRNVDIVDLLRREPVQTDIVAVQASIVGRRILITGAGGSIGGELCRQVLRCRPAQLVILGHGENSVFEIYHELRRLNTHDVELVPLIADTRFEERIGQIMAQYQPQIVYHAAAHKHVPMMELNPAEAITNNVLGTRTLLNAAVVAGVERFVLISTDKAVNPTSIMGASKRVAELLLLKAARETGKPFVAVRFGNVLGSRGSVVLTFRQQIATGGPVTVTDPMMARYFMTIPEAVQLVLQAAVLGEGGELFVLDMGEPVKIVDLARDLIELSGMEVGRDIEIEFTGARPGEKLFEELFVDGEQYHRTRHEKIFIAANSGSLVPDELDAAVNALEEAARCDDEAAIHKEFQSLLPEFQSMWQAANGPERPPISQTDMLVGKTANSGG